MNRLTVCLTALLLANTAWAATPRINVALPANGGVASTSSNYSASFPATALNNGERRGINWGAGGGWNDVTADQYPDWAQIIFNSPKTIDEIDVFTIQDNFNTPLEPTALMSFSQYGITAFDVQYWNGTTWVTVPNGAISNNNLVWRKVSFPAISTDRIRVLVNSALAAYSRVTEIEAYGAVGNVAPTISSVAATPQTLGDNATSQLQIVASDADSGPSALSYTWSIVSGGGSLSSTTLANPVYTPANVSRSTPVTINVAVADGVASVNSNITLMVNDASVPPTRTNVALPANGGVASTSSNYSVSFPATALNNGERKGINWGAGGGWNDATANQYPDWAQITFNGSKTIDEVSVYSIQDNYANPSEPTATSSFTLYGLAAFEVQTWNGTTWVTVPNGAISNNTLVWRKVSFPAITTDRIRVLVNSGLNSYSRIAEVEVYAASVSPAPTANNIYYVYPDHLNTPRVITDTANKTVWRWDADPFGTDIPNEDVDGDGRRFTYNHRFPGQYFDKETSLHYNYYRDGYDPGIGGYTQSDPLGLGGGSFSPYSYVGGNPVKYSDPAGLIRQIDPNGEECKALKKKIQNKKGDINKRIQQCALNPDKLPYSPPYPGAPPRMSVQGHEEIIQDIKDALTDDEALYRKKCGGDGGGGGSATAPATSPLFPPAKSNSPNSSNPSNNAGAAAAVGSALFIFFFLFGS